MNAKKALSIAAAGLFILFLLVSAAAAQPAATKYEFLPDIQKYIPYNGVFKRNFDGAFPLDVSSGLTFAGRDGKDLLFWAITNRGPATDAPAFRKTPDSKADVTKLFPTPAFAPSYSLIRIQNGRAMAGQITPIKDASGKAVPGLPLPNANVGSKNEVPLADDLKVLPTDLAGLDPGGIDIDKKDGNFWICDNYGPFIAKVDKTSGKIIEKLGPGKGLPLVLNLRKLDGGFEGVTLTPSNKVVAILKNVLDYDGNMETNHARFIRMMIFNQETQNVVMFAYPIDIEAYDNSGDAQIGDIAAISDTKFLVVEQGLDKNGGTRHLVYLVDISQASGLGDKLTKESKQLESESNVAELNKLGIYFAKKTLVCDLVSLGWSNGNVGGLAIIDNSSIAVIAGNNFGVNVKVDNPADSGGRPVTDIKTYETNYDRKLMLNGTTTSSTFSLVPNDKPMSFWIIKLAKGLNQF